MMWLGVRSVAAFLIQPGVVAFLVPWLMVGDWRGRDLELLGVIPLAGGAGLLCWCAGAFYRDGRGTLAPWDPPRRLVATGVYAISRNPMYVAVILIITGWSVTFGSRALAMYAAAVLLAFHARVVWGEEPWLARRYGADWERYAARVPRWLWRPRNRMRDVSLRNRVGSGGLDVKPPRDHSDDE